MLSLVMWVNTIGATIYKMKYIINKQAKHMPQKTIKAPSSCIIWIIAGTALSNDTASNAIKHTHILFGTCFHCWRLDVSLRPKILRDSAEDINTVADMGGCLAMG